MNFWWRVFIDICHIRNNFCFGHFVQTNPMAYKRLSNCQISVSRNVEFGFAFSFDHRLLDSRCIFAPKNFVMIYITRRLQLKRIIVTSTKAGKRFEVTNGSVESTPNGIKRIAIDRTTQFQKIIGWGVALTGASSDVLNSMTSKLSELVYRDVLSAAAGLNIDFIRLPLVASDNRTDPNWDNNKTADDIKDLSNFTVLDSGDLIQAEQIRQRKM